MDVTWSFDAEQKLYCLFRGNDLVLKTTSYGKALKKFNDLCDQMVKSYA